MQKTPLKGTKSNPTVACRIQKHQPNIVCEPKCSLRRY